MKIQRRILAVATGIALLLGVAAIVLWINRPDPNQQAQRADEVVRLLAEDLGSADLVSIRPDGGADLREFFAAAPAGPPPGLPDQLQPNIEVFEPTSSQLENLRAMLSDWLMLLERGDGQAYSAWMLSRGYTPTESPEIWDRSRRAYKALVGEQMPSDADAKRRFELIFEAVLETDEGNMRPIALSGAEYGRRLRFLGIQGVDGYFAEVFIYTQAEMERWVGYFVAGGYSHWDPPVSMQEIEDRHGHVPAVMASFAYRSATGQWRPTNVVLYLDPATSEWHLRQAWTVNAPTIATNLHY